VRGEKSNKLMDEWDHLQLVYARFVNSEYCAEESKSSKPSRGLVQRLKVANPHRFLLCIVSRSYAWHSFPTIFTLF
jgi:hypothetical protein